MTNQAKLVETATLQAHEPKLYLYTDKRKKVQDTQNLIQPIILCWPSGIINGFAWYNFEFPYPN